MYLYLLAYVYPLLVLCSQADGHWLFSVPIFTFVFVPLLDIFVGVDSFNAQEAEANEELRKGSWFRLITWFWVPVQLFILFRSLHWVMMSGRSTAEIVAIAVAVGLMNGVVGITYAHELMHKPNKWETFLADVLMTTVSYSHFSIEHIWGHHKNVGTPKDPATARLGESVYAFYWRAVTGSYISAWEIERKRLHGLKQAFWSANNRMLCHSAVLAVVYLALYCFGGWCATCFFALQSLIAFTSLEVINYMEHYGLSRDEITPGIYDRVLPKHSWNSGHRVSNWFLINLARHSDHHYKASKPYQLLENREFDAPQLPFGYGTMYLIALVPPLWFSIMNPLAPSTESERSASARSKYRLM